MNLTDSTHSILNDAKLYLEIISSADYSKSIPAVFDASIGVHTRHFIEFYQCLLEQIPSGIVNYCLRKRDESIEQNPTKAIKAIDAILAQLQALNTEKEVSVSTAKTEGVHVKSTVGRELYYNMEHCIHHLAMIKVCLQFVCPDMDIPSHFGYAPSTIQHASLVTHA